MSLDPHGGNIYAYDGVKLDFSVNLNPLGMPEEILQAVRDHGLEYDRYPDPNCRALRRALAAREGVPEEWLVFGNGAADLIVRLAMAVKPRLQRHGRGSARPSPGEGEEAVAIVGGIIVVIAIVIIYTPPVQTTIHNISNSITELAIDLFSEAKDTAISIQEASKKGTGKKQTKKSGKEKSSNTRRWNLHCPQQRPVWMKCAPGHNSRKAL